ncbi:hydrogenase assembly chaperone hypC/hupF [Desulfarculus baarsii DSM 2075]|uniref:Hydrogenase assembly chaperone hypC/hupF n=1 Tax=Desulfarculus baarsii (strain ATCC 33931 / DSM 2075 / LMG 7858 / VKM B-1802 / 2st14) TaxID=644282 RepID=E1QGS8_DESB2|nr:HypC/HybG/HupF family hydrogenase formation chaperone [Desulfarculus baarsii]ADK84771.1 hydrogenase assembly chaperone hypC/hupF [Desulfarculus baarsii DSM 2075]
MCLAAPAKVIELDEGMATVDVGGVLRRVSTVLAPPLKVGDYVIMHAGFAMHRLDESEALASLALLREMVEAVDRQGGGEKQS